MDRISRAVGQATPESRSGCVLRRNPIANAEEPHLVFKNLREKAARVLQDEPLCSASQHLAEVRQLVDRVQVAAPGTHATWQRNLERSALAFEEALALQGRSGGACEIIADRDRHVEAIRELIRSTERQLVIGCPFVKYAAVSQFRDEIRSILSSGCQVFFLLGIGDTFELEAGISSWLQGLKQDFPKQIFFSYRSACC